MTFLVKLRALASGNAFNPMGSHFALKKWLSVRPCGKGAINAAYVGMRACGTYHFDIVGLSIFLLVVA